MRLPFAKLTAGYAGLMYYEFFREVWVLQRPEAQKTRLQLWLVSAVDIILTITDHNQIHIDLINVNASNLAIFNNITFKCKQMLYWNSAIFHFLLILFFLLFLLFFNILMSTHPFLICIFILVIVCGATITQLNWRVVLIENMLLMILWLSQQSLNNLDCFHDWIRQLLIHKLSWLLDGSIGSSHGLARYLVGLGLWCALIRPLLRSLALVKVRVWWLHVFSHSFTWFRASGSRLTLLISFLGSSCIWFWSYRDMRCESFSINKCQSMFAALGQNFIYHLKILNFHSLRFRNTLHKSCISDVPIGGLKSLCLLTIPLKINFTCFLSQIQSLRAVLNICIRRNFLVAKLFVNFITLFCDGKLFSFTTNDDSGYVHVG